MAKKIGVTMEVGNDGVAVITISNPPVNSLASPIISGLKEKFRDANQRNDVKAIVLIGNNGRFSGGFDINVFQQVHKTGDLSLMPEVSVELVCNLMEDSRKPVVAAVEGLALGGGLELAMACHARVAAPKAQLGLPELTLGVIPGFGGTQRLPRLVGLAKATDMILLSKSISSEEGHKLGLIDALVPPGDVLSTSRKWALDIAEGRKPFLQSLHRTDKIGSLSEARAILKNSRQLAKKIAPNMPQHHACIEVIEEGIIHGGYSGVLKEAEVFKQLVLSDTAKGLVHVFFAQRATSKVPNVTDVGLKPRPIKKVAVIGGGLMGSGIATALLLSNIRVVLKEINSEFLMKGIKSVEANMKSLVSRGKLTQDKAGKALSLFKGVLDYTEFNDVDMVIEAVIENIQLKQNIFKEIEKVCSPHCILASNTSTIDLDVIGEKTNSKDRIVGAHFFSPAHLMPLLEIVRSKNTSAQVILDLMAVGKAIKKVPVVVGNCIGFAVNRTFFPYSQAAHMLANLGVDLFRIDSVITSFGLPLGPFQLGDLAGHGIGLAVGPIYAKVYGDRMFRSPMTELLLKSGRNGKINGRGYYIYEKGSKPKPDPSVLSIVEKSRKLTNIMPGGKPISVTDKEIVEMILFPVVNEACRVLDEGVVIRASDLDIASVLGMSFPSYRGGIVFWADTVGPKYIYERLKKLSETYGSFFKPSRYLEERAMNGMLLSESKSSRSKL
ncbi:AIM1 protein [Arabidopsis thaliana]|jgi:enoyl-CoA hydratase/3-hydroxyacyl-CoA dehydrogenase|uniref:Peroxisomal fatty acid beta-oxidation multifunctional protein AIM1 n=6 Tax=Arabidopsis TaxID=3701 RepID=AIM1_ARATH|nr:Enoyl-CoA hydratase/isomerase family [Arabidopsis thaliana]Q9ZPI6.1 RecName: Full=Peroxisomal fatty acid beta-oxidation multifunctional protein AIM1; AltName: Full=Protein ABNORMAL INFLORESCENCE MERISTEM 1; Short=AtAIM1; Includes: RecName: Full=Enoyl-CoA hydratase/3-2-trans-enoyl-CoA isomerase/3-hydroxybutyryl-CoA epimerase; Includes: RecName: Full=3-hydroxyacyl-CoA dehydrogenase [Arabidopsis thaliana]KAG7617731.1 ClpP/crotonase-like domain superfamily [Arabidopsis thaliana x Arabidopsis areno|eukprot:NP_194630.1 Enoyl-CoA hydratase/isomerase family [Arabidopsis thaliana]